MNGIKYVTISRKAFVYATPLVAELDGIKGRFFSKRLYNAVISFATNFGYDVSAVSEIANQKFGIKFLEPGTELKNLLNEAAIHAVREGKTIINESNILDALDKLIVGLVKQQDERSSDARRRVAIHEIGHAFLAAYYKEYFELKKVTIQSTYNGAGGYTIFNEYANVTESGLYTKDLLIKRLIVTMGGKAAETIFYGNEHVSLGAVQDLKQANSLAKRMIGNYGMGKKLEAFYNENVEDERNPFLGRSLAMGDKYSEKIKDTMDRETLELVTHSLSEAKQILLKNQENITRLVDILLNHTTLTGVQFEQNMKL